MPSGGISRRRRGTARLVNRSSADLDAGASGAWLGFAARATDESRQTHATNQAADGANPVIIFIGRCGQLVEHSRIKPVDDQPICRPDGVNTTIRETV